MPRRKNYAALLRMIDTGSRPAMAGTYALPHLDKNACAVRRAHDQVNFSTPAPGRPIIALHKAQTGLLQIVQRSIFGCIAYLFGRADLGLDLRKYH